MEGTYKTFDFDFNLLEESTYELEFNGGAISPIKGSHVESNKIKVDLNHISTGGYVSRPNVYDLVNKTILVNEEALISRLDNIRTNGYIQTYETDLKKERIIYGIQLLNSEFKGKILITDFDSNILDEIFVNSVPSKIQIL